MAVNISCVEILLRFAPILIVAFVSGGHIVIDMYMKRPTIPPMQTLRPLDRSLIRVVRLLRSLFPMRSALQKCLVGSVNWFFNQLRLAGRLLIAFGSEQEAAAEAHVDFIISLYLWIDLFLLLFRLRLNLNCINEALFCRGLGLLVIHEFHYLLCILIVLLAIDLGLQGDRLHLEEVGSAWGEV